jgi:Flp pilus assembly protein TadG
MFSVKFIKSRHHCRRSVASSERIARCERGTALVEFGLAVPVLLLIVVGTAQFGLALNSYVTLTDAVRAGARQFAVSRGDSSPKTNAVNRIYSSAPNLTQADLTIALSVNGTACATDSACSTALASGLPATVTASYPCSLVVSGINFAPSGCTLTAQTTERVE